MTVLLVVALAVVARVYTRYGPWFAIRAWEKAQPAAPVAWDYFLPTMGGGEHSTMTYEEQLCAFGHRPFGTMDTGEMDALPIPKFQMSVYEKDGSANPGVQASYALPPRCDDHVFDPGYALFKDPSRPRDPHSLADELERDLPVLEEPLNLDIWSRADKAKVRVRVARSSKARRTGPLFLDETEEATLSMIGRTAVALELIRRNQQSGGLTFRLLPTDEEDFILIPSGVPDNPFPDSHFDQIAVRAHILVPNGFHTCPYPTPTPGPTSQAPATPEAGPRRTQLSGPMHRPVPISVRGSDPSPTRNATRDAEAEADRARLHEQEVERSRARERERASEDPFTGPAPPPGSRQRRWCIQTTETRTFAAAKGRFFGALRNTMIPAHALLPEQMNWDLWWASWYSWRTVVPALDESPNLILSWAFPPAEQAQLRDLLHVRFVHRSLAHTVRPTCTLHPLSWLSIVPLRRSLWSRAALQAKFPWSDYDLIPFATRVAGNDTFFRHPRLTWPCGATRLSTNRNFVLDNFPEATFLHLHRERLKGSNATQAAPTVGSRKAYMQPPESLAELQMLFPPLEDLRLRRTLYGHFNWAQFTSVREAARHWGSHDFDALGGPTTDFIEKVSLVPPAEPGTPAAMLEVPHHSQGLFVKGSTADWTDGLRRARGSLEVCMMLHQLDLLAPIRQEHLSMRNYTATHHPWLVERAARCRRGGCVVVGREYWYIAGFSRPKEGRVGETRDDDDRTRTAAAGEDDDRARRARRLETRGEGFSGGGLRAVQSSLSSWWDRVDIAHALFGPSIEMSTRPPNPKDLTNETVGEIVSMSVALSQRILPADAAIRQVHHLFPEEALDLLVLFARFGAAMRLPNPAAKNIGLEFRSDAEMAHKGNQDLPFVKRGLSLTGNIVMVDFEAAHVTPASSVPPSPGEVIDILMAQNPVVVALAARALGH